MTTITEEPGVELVTVRTMLPEDLAAVVKIDAASAGRARPRYYERMIQRAQSGLQISLVAEKDDRVIGFLVGSLYYGEYGLTEPTATIDAIGVEPDSQRTRVAHALLQQFRGNVTALGVTSIRTEVEWSRFALLGFLQSEGFTPAPRLCLELPLAK